ncbi:MFS transporter [Niallia oryzisoli]|uniref:MFS transporter n=1 Tax=Niallia oryzisoli TaxID=1737571 RepID=A0ABZ2CGY1_9BACI
MKEITTINANAVYDKSKFNRFHLSLFLWCSFIILFDGYDTTLFGALVPVLMDEWGMTPVETGSIGSYKLIGTIVGAIIFGILADKIGRKKSIIICVVLFSGFTPLSAFANGPEFFTVCQVIAGIGLGGVMPTIVALTSEFAPKKSRNAMVSGIFCFFAIGAILISFVGKYVVASIGWQPLYYLAAIPLLLLPIYAKTLPESLRILAKRGDDAEIRRILQKGVPEEKIPSHVQFEKPQEENQQKSSIGSLMKEKRGLSSMMFWIASLSSFLLMSSMNTWLTKLMIQAGYSLDSSLTFLAFLNGGSVVGIILFGRLIDKYGFKKTLIPLFLAGSISLLFVSVTKITLVAYVLVMIIGAASTGMQSLLLPIVAQYYPTEMRSTGTGIMMAFGRIGGVIAPILIGYLIAQNFAVTTNFQVISIAGFIGALSLVFIQEKYADYREAPVSEPAQEVEEREVVITH